jgi:hypothetical protein
MAGWMSWGEEPVVRGIGLWCMGPVVDEEGAMRQVSVKVDEKKMPRLRYSEDRVSEWCMVSFGRWEWWLT